MEKVSSDRRGPQIARIISTIETFDGLSTFEVNARRRDALTDEIKQAIKHRAGEIGRDLLNERTSLDLTNLSPAEEKIVETLGDFLRIRKGQGKSASRTLSQVRRRGLIGAAKAAVKTPGFQTLADADLADLSYEQIIVDHPDEFSPRALWYARRTLGLPNESDRPPQQVVGAGDSDAPYSVFVCNPKIWAIDRFLDRRIEQETWGIRPTDQTRFAPGQLGIIRVGVDRRSAAERAGSALLVSGIYALCEVESEAFPGGSKDEFWADGKGHPLGWPTVKIRYLRTYMNDRLTIERLRRERPGASKLLLNGFQAASFQIPAADFHAVMDLLGEPLDDLPDPERDAIPDFGALAVLEAKYLNASPEIKERVSKMVERGPIGTLVKRANGYKCQVCEALGRNPIGFLKKNGEPYVEAHHVTPISRGEVGSLSSSNVMTICANHHRQIHYGSVEITIAPKVFNVVIDEQSLAIAKVTVLDESSHAA